MSSIELPSSMKLIDERNYELWKVHIRLLFQSNGLEKHVLGFFEPTKVADEEDKGEKGVKDVKFEEDEEVEEGEKVQEVNGEEEMVDAEEYIALQQTITGQQVEYSENVDTAEGGEISEEEQARKIAKAKLVIVVNISTSAQVTVAKCETAVEMLNLLEKKYTNLAQAFKSNTMADILKLKLESGDNVSDFIARFRGLAAQLLALEVNDAESSEKLLAHLFVSGIKNALPDWAKEELFRDGGEKKKKLRSFDWLVNSAARHVSEGGKVVTMIASGEPPKKKRKQRESEKKG